MSGAATTAEGNKTVIGFAQEVTYGTRVAPTNFLEVIEESLGLKRGTTPQPVLNRTGQAYYAESKKDVGGGFSFPMLYQGAEILLKHLCGGTPQSTQVGVTGVYTHRFALGDVLPVGLSIFKALDFANLGTAYALPGAQISKMTFSQEKEAFMKATLELVAREQVEVGNSAASYPTFRPVEWDDVSTLTVGGVTLECQMAEFTIENALADDRYKLGDLRRIGLGRGGGVRKVSGKLLVEFESVTRYNLFANGTEAILAAAWTGPIAANATPFAMRLTCPRIRFEGTAPTAKDHGPVPLELPWTAYVDKDNAYADEIKVELDNLLTSVP